MDSRERAIEKISETLFLNDSDLYVFQPQDSNTNYFIGSALIASAAGILLAAFLKGFTSSLEGRAEELGHKLGDWLNEQLEDLFRAKYPDSESINKAISSANTISKGSSNNEIELFLMNAKLPYPKF